MLNLNLLVLADLSSMFHVQSLALFHAPFVHAHVLVHVLVLVLFHAPFVHVPFRVHAIETKHNKDFSKNGISFFLSLYTFSIYAK